MTAHDPEAQLEEARALIQAAWRTPDRRRHRKLIAWAKKILEPLATAGMGRAAWCLTCLPQERMVDSSQEEFERLYTEKAKMAAEGGSVEAMFFLGCELDREATLEESTTYFRAAANQGHPYSMWCYGLNLISGRGTQKDHKLGLQFIELAAKARFEGAIQFLSHAYAQGSYGYEKNEALAAEWWSALKGEDVIRY